MLSYSPINFSLLKESSTASSSSVLSSSLTSEVTFFMLLICSSASTVASSFALPSLVIPCKTSFTDIPAADKALITLGIRLS